MPFPKSDYISTKKYRRPSAARYGIRCQPALYREAEAIPHGTGLALSDRELMILCFLPCPERHLRASKVFSERGEWYSRYKYMATQDDDFLRSCNMPRLCVPRSVTDRPWRRNLKQAQLDEADRAKLRASLPPPRRGTNSTSEPESDEFGVYQSSIDISGEPVVYAGCAGANTFHGLPHNTAWYGYGHPYNVDLRLCMLPELNEPDALQFMCPDASFKAYQLFVTLNLGSMEYSDICSSFMRIYNLEQRVYGVPETYVGSILAKWTEPATGRREVRNVFEYNWASEIRPFVSSHLVIDVEIDFGIAVAENFEHSVLPQESKW